MDFRTEAAARRKVTKDSLRLSRLLNLSSRFGGDRDGAGTAEHLAALAATAGSSLAASAAGSSASALVPASTAAAGRKRPRGVEASVADMDAFSATAGACPKPKRLRASVATSASAQHREASASSLSVLLRKSCRTMLDALKCAGRGRSFVDEYRATGLIVVQPFKRGASARRRRPLQGFSASLRFMCALPGSVHSVRVNGRKRTFFPPGTCAKPGLAHVLRKELLPIARMLEPALCDVDDADVHCQVEGITATPTSDIQDWHTDFIAAAGTVLLVPMRDSMATRFMPASLSRERFEAKERATAALKGRALADAWLETPLVPAGGFAVFNPMMLHQGLPLAKGALPRDALFISFRFLGARAAASAPPSATAPGTVDTASVKRLLARMGKPYCDMNVGTFDAADYNNTPATL